MLMKNQSQKFSPRPLLQGFAVVCAALLFAGCATQQARRDAHVDHGRMRFGPPQPELPPTDVPYGKTDWKAVVASLNGAGDKAGQFTKAAGGYSKAMWANTGGKMVDFAAGRIVTSAAGQPSECGYCWPANGKISRGFKPQDNHKGLDITADIGTPVHAARAGRVIYASNELSGFGNCIIIQHDSIWTTFYAHNNQNFVQPGDIVQAGQLIAEVGKTGRATGPHLHFEIRENGNALDPHPMLPH